MIKKRLEEIPAIAIIAFLLYVVISLMINGSLFGEYYTLGTLLATLVVSIVIPINQKSKEFINDKAIVFSGTAFTLVFAMISFLSIGGDSLDLTKLSQAWNSIGWVALLLFISIILGILGKSTEHKDLVNIYLRSTIFTTLLTFLTLLSFIIGIAWKII